MARLIDADALIQNHGNDVTNWDNPYAVKISSIENAPTVDAVEVVRCKDCQKCLIDNSKMEIHLCMKRAAFPVRVKLDGFCSYGERKEGDGNGLFQP